MNAYIYIIYIYVIVCVCGSDMCNTGNIVAAQRSHVYSINTTMWANDMGIEAWVGRRIQELTIESRHSTPEKSENQQLRVW